MLDEKKEKKEQEDINVVVMDYAKVTAKSDS